MKRLIDKKKEAITMTELNIILEEGFDKMFGDIINNPVIKEIESKDNNKND